MTLKQSVSRHLLMKPEKKKNKAHEVESNPEKLAMNNKKHSWEDHLTYRND